MNANLWFKDLLVYRRWSWHVLFWTGYILFRFWVYYITVSYYKRVYLEYMLLSELFFVFITYFTIWLYRRLFEKQKYGIYFLVGLISWILYLYAKTYFQLYYLRNEPSFRGNSLANIVMGSITFIPVYFLFITACKYFKDGYISQQFEAEKKQQQLLAEINNLKSQIAPHFLFNTLNNLYGLAVDKSDKLPNLMLRLSDLLRHSLYETQKSLVPLGEEIKVLKSYMDLERVRLESNLKLHFDNTIPENTPYQISPLLLIVFMENAFKHAKTVQIAPVEISIQLRLRDDWFSFIIKNNYNQLGIASSNGIGLRNVIRRLELLYPNAHQLNITKDEAYYTVALELKLIKTLTNAAYNGA